VLQVDLGAVLGRAEEVDVGDVHHDLGEVLQVSLGGVL